MNYERRDAVSHLWLRRVERLFWPSVGIFVLAFALQAARVRTGLPSVVVYEGADASGDMLQVQRALSRGWFLTGHHTDVGAAHPGPFALWLKALVDWVHQRGVGSSTYALTMLAFVAVRALIVTSAAWAIGLATRSRIAGLLFGVGVLATGNGIVTDNVGATIHHLTSWAMVLLLASAVAHARVGRLVLPLLTLAAGMAAHLHTPLFALGVSSLLVVLILLWQQRRERAPVFYVSSGLWLLFVTPLVVRAIVQPGFPYSYLAAARNRTDEARDVNGRSALDTLSSQLHIPVTVVVGMLFACLVLGVGMLVHRRLSGIIVVATALYAGLVIAVSPPQSRVATELTWILGIGMFWRGMLYAAPVVIGVLLWNQVRSRRDDKHDLVRSRSARVRAAVLLASFAILGGLYPAALRQAFALPLSTSGGTSGAHAPALVDAMLEASGTQPLMLILGNRWFELGAAPILELERRDAVYCVVVPTPFLESLDLFLPYERLCPSGVTGIAFVLDNTGQDPGIPQQRLVFRQATETHSPDGTPIVLTAWVASCTRSDTLYPACVNWPNTVLP
jgi:hypothetical protein